MEFSFMGPPLRTAVQALVAANRQLMAQNQILFDRCLTLLDRKADGKAVALIENMAGGNGHEDDATRVGKALAAGALSEDQFLRGGLRNGR